MASARDETFAPPAPDKTGAEPGRPAEAVDTSPGLTDTVRNLRLLSKRLRRLFACACCRRLGRRLAPACRRAVEAAERFADGSAGPEELAESGRACRQWEKLGRPVSVEESGDE